MASQSSNTTEGLSSDIGDRDALLVKAVANLDPNRFQEKTHWAFSSDATEAFGIIESKWEPMSENKLLKGCTPKYIWQQKCRQLTFKRDLCDFKPTRLTFTVPHPDTDMNNNWFEFLFVTLRNLVHTFCTAHFSSELSKPAGNANWSPWETALPTQFLHYAAKIARKDDWDGGWQSLMIDPRQRAYMVMGIMAMALEEHAISDLLFGASEHHQHALSYSDRMMLQEEGKKHFLNQLRLVTSPPYLFRFNTDGPRILSQKETISRSAGNPRRKYSHSAVLGQGR